LSTILKEAGPSLQPPIKKKQPEPQVYKYNGRALRPVITEAKKRNFANRICNLQVSSNNQLPQATTPTETNNDTSNIDNTFEDDPNYNPYADSPAATIEVDSSSNDSLQIIDPVTSTSTAAQANQDVNTSPYK
jgi:hypothetical protein